MKLPWTKPKVHRMAVELPANVIRFEDYKPHSVEEMVCIHCHHRWVGIFTSIEPLRDLRCPGCMETGGVILTGQPIYDDIAHREDDFYGR